MDRLHIIVIHTDAKPKVLYIGSEGAAADKAYDTAKGCETVEHYQYPMPTRRRAGDSATRQTVIRQRTAPVATKPSEPKPKG